MPSATDDPELEAVIRFWGHAYAFEYDPDTDPAKPRAAHRKDGKGTVRAASLAELLDAIKDDAAAQPFTGDHRTTDAPVTHQDDR